MGFETKKKIFRAFNKNLLHVLEWGRASENLSDGYYLCPLTFELFQEGSLVNGDLTAEHAPPKKLGGKVVALTSGSANSKAGHQYEKNLKNYFDFSLAANDKALFETRFKLGDGSRIRGKFSKSKIEFRPSKGYLQHRQNPLKGNRTINLSFGVEYKEMEYALLKSAYMLFFRRCGYGLILNPGMQLVRDQLNKSSSNPKFPFIQKQFPDEFLGVNIINEPKHLRSWFLIFDLGQVEKLRFGVFLPGPDESYREIIRLFAKKQSSEVRFDLIGLKQNVDIRTKAGSKHFLRVWKETNGWTE